MSRQTIFEKPDNIKLARRSIEIFSELQKQTELELMANTGFYYIEESTTDLHGQIGVFDKMSSLSNSHDVSINTSPIIPKFLPLNKNARYLLDNSGHVLYATNCVTSLQSSAVSFGAEIVNNKASLKLIKGTFKVVADGQNISYQHLIVSAGFNNNQVLKPLGVSLSYQVCPQRIYWYKIEESYREVYQKLFKPTVKVFTIDGETRFFYSFLGIDGNTIKIGTEIYDNSPLLDGEIFYRQYIKPNFIGVTSELVGYKDCNYCVTPDHDFIIQELNKYPNITVISACSGQGFKFSAAYGEQIISSILNK